MRSSNRKRSPPPPISPARYDSQEAYEKNHFDRAGAESHRALFASGDLKWIRVLERTNPVDPATNQFIEGGIAAQTERVLENLKSVLEAAGSSLERVVKTTVYLKDMGEFAKMNEVYGRYFTSNAPARATVEAARLPRDVAVEIDCIAAVD